MRVANGSSRMPPTSRRSKRQDGSSAVQPNGKTGRNDGRRHNREIRYPRDEVNRQPLTEAVDYCGAVLIIRVVNDALEDRLTTVAKQSRNVVGTYSTTAACNRQVRLVDNIALAVLDGIGIGVRYDSWHAGYLARQRGVWNQRAIPRQLRRVM